jgi:NADH:ubiquinone oxidoreductase subunit F (NADH-binding)
MDRSIMEGDAHSVIEGMLLAGYAIGASQGYVYIRAEYPLAVNRLKTALNQARAYGMLGQKYHGHRFQLRYRYSPGRGRVCLR